MITRTTIIPKIKKLLNLSVNHIKNTGNITILPFFGLNTSSMKKFKNI